MFTVSKKNMGRWVAVEIHDPKADTGLVIVPERGGCLLGLTLRGRQILDAYETESDLGQLEWMKNTVLFPFPNRLKNGTYEFGGASYTFPINDKKTGNALHGFGLWSSMEISSDLEAAESGRLSIRYEDEGFRPFYPFPFEYRMDFEFEGSNALKVTQHFQNLGDRALPLGFGWHPYFRLTASVEEGKLRLPASKLVEIDEFMIPTGKLLPAEDLQSLKPIGARSWDDCYALEITGQPVETVLETDKGTLRFWQETGPGKYNFLQLFTPDHRRSIAIEPMTCNVDAFNNGEGLIVLKPWETCSASFGLRLDS